MGFIIGVILAVILIPAIVAALFDISWWAGLAICLGILIVIAVPVFLFVNKQSKNAEAVATEKRNKLNDADWVRANPQQAKEYRLDLNNVPRSAAVGYKLRLGHTYGSPGYEIFSPGFPDSAGGWDVQMTISNNTNRTINYMNFVVTPLDRVGNVCKDRFGKSQTTINYTGPIGAFGKAKDLVSEHIWYDVSLGSLQIDGIEILFSDNTKQILYSNGSFTNYDSQGNKIEM